MKTVEYATKGDVVRLDAKLESKFDALDAKIDKAVADISDLISGFVVQVDERFNKVEVGMDTVKTDIREVKEEIIDLKESHNRLLNTIDGFISRIDRYETEQAARDHKMARLEKWIEQIAAKTGVKLEY